MRNNLVYVSIRVNSNLLGTNDYVIYCSHYVNYSASTGPFTKSRKLWRRSKEMCHTQCRQRMWQKHIIKYYFSVSGWNNIYSQRHNWQGCLKGWSSRRILSAFRRSQVLQREYNPEWQNDSPAANGSVNLMSPLRRSKRPNSRAELLLYF